jgi:hypothetical protein
MLLNEIGSPKQEALADWSCSGVVGLISPLIMSVFSFHAFSKAKPYFISEPSELAEYANSFSSGT